MSVVGRHAVVLGSSMAGLLAARALAPHFERVTLLERDHFPAHVAQRKGVPQGQHAHGLLASGFEALEDFFPSFGAELMGRGALGRDVVHDGRWIIHGVRLATAPSDVRGLFASRPLLERYTRERVLELANVQVLEGCDVLGVVGDAARIHGVMLRRAGSAVEQLAADLVVDASGRGSRTPKWLEGLGLAAPEEQRVRVDVGYASCTFRRKPQDLDGKLSLVVGAQPPNRRCGVALALEGDRWIVTLAGYLGDHAPADMDHFVRFARGLPAPDLYQLLQRVEPLSEPVPAKFPHSQRRYYERLQYFPDGLVVLGDALCSFTPTYGQGMSVCALEARLLDHCLRWGLPGLARRFFLAAAPLLDVPWSIAVGADLGFAGVEGPRSWVSRALGGYIRRVHRTSAQDARVTEAFQRVSNLLAPPSSLFAPTLVARVFLGSGGAALPVPGRAYAVESD